MNVAYDIARRPNPPSVLSALQRGRRELATDSLRIATQGLYDADKYGSDSEARQAALPSSVYAGMTLAQVVGRLDSGAWIGLNASYSSMHQSLWTSGPMQR